MNVHFENNSQTVLLAYKITFAFFNAAHQYGHFSIKSHSIFWHGVSTSCSGVIKDLHQSEELPDD